MYCPNCGENNNSSFKFCTKCGTELNTEVELKEKKERKKLNISSYLLNIFVKPIETLKHNGKNISDTMFSGILLLIPTLIMLISTVLKGMFKAIQVTEYIWGEGTVNTWKFSNLAHINYIDLVIKNFLIYILVIIGISVIFYVASLIMKKSTNFFSILSITSTSIIPVSVFCFILCPLFSLVWTYLGVIASIIGIVYGTSLFVTLMNNHLKLEGDTCVFYYTVCFSVILLITYFILVNYISSLLIF